MAKLILSLEGSVIREIALDKERVTIGRKPQNDVQIENLAVSGEHACIVTILNDSFLEDLGSTNGTLVNGNPIKKHILQNNDVIEIGKYKLKYIGEAPAAGQMPANGGEKALEIVALVEVQQRIEGRDHERKPPSQAYAAHVAPNRAHAPSHVARLALQALAQAPQHRPRQVDAYDFDAGAGHGNRNAPVADAVLEHGPALALGEPDVPIDVLAPGAVRLVVVRGVFVVSERARVRRTAERIALCTSPAGHASLGALVRGLSRCNGWRFR